ncbi:MAG: hypothetical protein IJ588_06800 [Prevotella sp.]|nr:hypothetical protein [Prevotella sp.]
MRNGLFTFALSLLVIFSLFASCEKMVTDEEEGQQQQPAIETGANLILKVVAAGTRGDSAPWTTLNFVVYQADKKVKGITQKEGENGFGEVGMKLTPGTYQVMVLAHSSASNPSLSNPENIKFTNADGFSDTFVAYQDVVVEETAKTHEISVTRASAMVRFKTKDVKPAEAKQVSFLYTGGSGAINVKTGYGVDQSKQTVTVNLPDSLTGKPLQFELYTFPRADEAALTLTVRMFDATDNKGTLLIYPGSDQGIRTFSDIPIKKNQITECSGYFFTDGSGDGPGGGGSTGGGNGGSGESADSTATQFMLVVNPEWGGVVEYNY